MEQILWRLTIVSVVAAFATGLAYYFFQDYKLHRVQNEVVERKKQADSKLEKCTQSARAEYSIILCKSAWRDDINPLADYPYIKAKREAGKRIGVAIAALSPAAIIAFLTIRWIFTGRWRRKPNPA